MPVHTHAQYVTANTGGPAVRCDYASDARGLLYPQGINTGEAGGGQAYYPYSYACKVWVRTA